MEITEPMPTPGAQRGSHKKRARGRFERKLVAVHSADGTLLFGDCKGSGAENYRPSADFAEPAKRSSAAPAQAASFPCKHSLALLYAHAREPSL